MSKLPRTGDYLVGRSKELATLTRAWNNPKTCIVQIVAPGGVGKTQLVKKWRESLLDKDDHGGAARAFDWSFYSQGTGQQASADDFFDRALRWFGEAEPENVKDPWAKGERLAELVRQQRTLLILDGMEPLQHPPGPMAGELTDPSIKALLQGLQRDNPGLCIVTTREAVPTLDEMSDPKRVTVDLDSLSPQAGAELLEHYGVTGEQDERRQASVDVDGHALALILLGTYLKTRYGGDVRRRSEALLFQGHERYAAHAHKVMASYEAWFEQQDDTGRAAVAILRLMGLFNRPADAGCLAALRAEPPLPGLTEALHVGGNDEMRDEVWQRAIERLRAARLLADDDSSNQTSQIENQKALDAHPLVREHFAGQLAHHHQASSVDAHRRLYEHLKSVPKDELPDNLNDMMPLYHAVSHGCKAREVGGAFDLYFIRILRKKERFSVFKLGSFGSDLAAITNFFETPWTKVEPTLQMAIQGNLIGYAGFFLRALGRLRETIGPMQASFDAAVTFDNRAIRASNLSELSLTLGDVSSAVRQGEQSVELADRSGDAFQRMSKRTTLAAALIGSLKSEVRSVKGEEVSHFTLLTSIFEEAEAMQQEMQPQYPLLYSLAGYGYCDLLLDMSRPDQTQRRSGSMDRDAEDAGTALRSVRPTEPADESPEQAIARIREVRNRAETWFEWRVEDDSILDTGLAYLTLGRTYLLESQGTRVERQEQEEGSALDSCLSALDSAEKHLSQSVSLLRQAGTQHWIPAGLLHCSALWRAKFQISNSKSQFELAKRDLNEAESIAERGSMLIWQIEAALERTRLYLTLGHSSHHAPRDVGNRADDSSEQNTLAKSRPAGDSHHADRDDYITRAREKLAEAKQLVKQSEKPYEPYVPDWEEWEPPEYVGVFKKGEIVGYHCRNGEIEALQAAIDRGVEW